MSSPHPSETLSLVARLDATPFATVEQMESFLKAALTAYGLDDSEFDVASPDYHPDWDTTKACPNCGSRERSVMAADEDIEHVDEDGSIHFVRKGDAFGEALSTVCNNCGLILVTKPYGALSVPSEPPMTESIPEPQWEHESRSDDTDTSDEKTQADD
jgi:hypothetical protein